LELYRKGRDVYVVTAANMFHLDEREIDADLRQSGKIAELALQYGGGREALIGMAKNYGVVFDDAEADKIVSAWRKANPWATGRKESYEEKKLRYDELSPSEKQERKLAAFKNKHIPGVWGRYQDAINECVLAPGTPIEVGRVTYMSDGDFLWCQLPSERMLAYPRPLWETYFTPWDEERVGPTFQTHFKPAAGDPPLRNHARGALLFQNTVQAVAADLLRESLLLADDKGLNIVGHTHDEIIGIGSDTDGAILNKIMLETPWWAEGLPIATGGVSVGTRYGK
jgi:DNA polymerase